MTLTERFFAVFGFIQVIGILATWRAEFLIAYLLLLALLGAVALFDARSVLRESDFRAALDVPRHPRLGETVRFDVKVTPVSARAGRLRELRLLAPSLGQFRFQLPQRSWHPHRGVVTMPFNAEVVRLGYHRFEHWPAVAVARGGLVQRILDLPLEPVELRVAPERASLSEQAFQELIQSQRILSQGARLQTRTRSQDQFHSLRPYQYPDPLRHIDQKKTARYGSPITRTFDTLRSHHLIIALDTGRAASGSIRGSQKIDYYLSAALALAENALKTRDEVSFFAFSRQSHSLIRRARSLASFQRLFRSEDVFEPRDEESDFGLLARQIPQMAGSRSIVVILTDSSKPSVQDSLLAALAPVCKKHLAVVASLNDRSLDLETRVLGFPLEAASAAPLLRDSGAEFTTAYADLLYSYWLHEKQLLFRERLTRLGGASLAIDDAQWITTVEKLYELLRNSRLA